LGEANFPHDLENVDQQADEFDLALSAPGLRTIRRKVDWIGRRTVPSPELFRRFDSDMFWDGNYT